LCNYDTSDLTITVDPDNSIEESDETNNVLVAAVNGILGGGAMTGDQGSSGTDTSDQGTTTGDQSTGPLDLYLTNFKMSDDNSVIYVDLCTVNSSAQNIKMSWTANGVTSSYTIDQQVANSCVTIPNGGTYDFYFNNYDTSDLTITVDPDNSIEESDETNNMLVATVNGILGGGAMTGDQGSSGTDTSDQGTTTGDQSTGPLDLYLTNFKMSDDNSVIYVDLCTVNSSAQNIKMSWTANGLTTNYTIDQQVANSCVTIPNGGTYDFYFNNYDTSDLTITVDTENTIVESDETNNVLTGTVIKK